VSALTAAANEAVPTVKPNVRKPWWDETLSFLKSLSIEAHQNWVEAGRPKQGDVFMEKQKAKLLYKKRIADNKKLGLDVISDSLQNKLMDSDQISFWKIWRKEFGSRTKNSNCIDGLSDDNSIANRFADIFANTCKPKNIIGSKSDIENSRFQARLYEYKGAAYNYEQTCCIMNIESAIGNLSNGKAAGYDLLTAEFLKYSHPIVWSCLSKLFSIMLLYSYVPDAFGVGITVPLLKADNKGSASCSDSYRGITIMPIISKLFELVLLNILNPFLITCNSQFGFKRGQSCAHAVYSVRKTVDYFTMLNSTVNLCALDISKAFDRVNHVKLFSKMMDRNIPVNCILLLSCWYAKSIICVRWGACFSHFVYLETGVRQGSSLSPKLFALFVDNLLVSLKSSGLGCYIKGFCFNAVMYADDLLLLSISITHLQKMINICVDVLGACDLEINAKKSCCLRIGPRQNVTTCTLSLNGQSLLFKSEIRYLGVFIVSSKKFKCNLQNPRQKFFQSANGIFGKIGLRAQPSLILSLIDTFCIPLLLYGLDALLLTNSERSTLDFIYSTVYLKVFHVKEKVCINLCQYYSGCLPASYRLDVRKINFMYSVFNSYDSLPYQLVSLLGSDDLVSLMARYVITPRDSAAAVKAKVWTQFGKDLQL
jgi:hypothetical protein